MMEEKHNGICCKKGDIVRIKGLSDTVKVVFLGSNDDRTESAVE